MADPEHALRDAAREGDDIMVKKLLANGAEQSEDRAGDTALLLATSHYITEPKFVNIVRTLLEASADVNHKNREGNAAIHNASSNGSLEIVELLLAHGADIEMEGEQMMVPLAIAATKKHHAVVNALVKKLIDEQKFSRKQVEWMYNVENEVQQLHVYRALTSIFAEKEALKAMIKYDVISAILTGMKKYKKTSVQSSALQLLATCMSVPEGLEVGKGINIGNTVRDACKDYENDPVIQHLINNVIEQL